MELGKKPAVDILFLLIVFVGLMVVVYGFTPSRSQAVNHRHVSWACRDAADPALETQRPQALPRPLLVKLFFLDATPGRQRINEPPEWMSRSVATSILRLALGPRRLAHGGGEEPAALI